MKYRIELGKKALKSLKNLPRKEILKISSRIDTLAKDPRPSDVKKIKGDKDLYRIRSGDYRILYRIIDSVLQILVVDINHRKKVYQNL